jgi:hypothetical protein
MTGATFALLTLTTLILEIEINGHILTWFRSNDLFHIQVKHQRVLNQILLEIEYDNITDKNQGRDLDFSSSQLSELFNQNELNPIKKLKLCQFDE